MHSHPIPTHYKARLATPATLPAMELWSSTLLLLLALGSSQGLDLVELTLLGGAVEKGAGTWISFNY
jgi:hypothetical protein